ncbi:30S ribosomal protein S20 [Candidatus Nomurabacteria bacterium]|uniref:Small ribosomal subunit protein bS20 n=1 Tax=candidate division WWE3 bacterium TaxID=2053526 RepID=A0A955IWQ8_UNCKA|nr:30S ribosomal protein S20 [candidate division WWE3 bacterium]MCB9823811.1 30S ribosomal protein S20 [Candidatus Nomurabacteria bacterium]MCB9826783.1 30S ribosomal protein S20 [Candidatus Nomurabacteria bacterium]MCB9827606.1 30S ribosomal protein S20 [Candidatus Nomurabacteria bacterium]HXK52606.1 30S ribosomal protein S20 [bacterium]
MANTQSAKKAVRSSAKKRLHNIFWKTKIKASVKAIEKLLSTNTKELDIIKEQERVLYKVVDKAAKNNVIHKNKAARIKSKISKKVSANAQGPEKEKNTAEKETKVSTASKEKASKSKAKTKPATK